jgi:hypothetical protein
VVVPRREAVTAVLSGTAPATAANYGVFYTVGGSDTPRAGTKAIYEVTSITARWETAGSDGSAVTLAVSKVPSGTAKASGTTVMSGTIDLKGTANTVNTATLTATLANRRLIVGDSLALILSGTPTAVAGLSVTVELKRIPFQN